MPPHLSVGPNGPQHDHAIETMLDHAFGLSRRTKTSYRLREGNSPAPGLSLAAHEGEVVVGAISYWPIVIGEAGTPALLLGPLVVHWQRQNQGIGLRLMQESLAKAKAQGHKLVLLVGDEPYYARVGFKVVPHGLMTLPGPVDPCRFLYLELEPNALSSVAGLVLPPARYDEIYRPSRNHVPASSASAAAKANSDANSG